MRQIQAMPRRFDVSWRKPVSGLVLNLSMQDQSIGTLKDRSGQGNDGTITGATWAKLPSGLWYLDFDGTDDYVDCGNAASLQIETYLIIECWVYLDTSGGGWMGIAGKFRNSGAQNAYLLAKEATTDKVNFRITKDGGTGAGQASRFSNTALTVNTWTHIRAIYEFVSDGNSKMDIEQNGVSTLSVSNAVGDIFQGTDDFFFGSYTGGANEFTGGLALLRVFNASTPSHYQQERHLFGV